MIFNLENCVRLTDDLLTKTTMNNQKPLLSVNDEVWYVLGFLLVKCKVVEIDEWDKDLRAYWIDEPVGHACDESLLHTNKKDAIKELIINFRECTEPTLNELISGREKPISDLILNADLIETRRRQLKFVYENWEHKPDIEESLKEYPEKKHGEDWFSVTDLGIEFI